MERTGASTSVRGRMYLVVFFALFVVGACSGRTLPPEAGGGDQTGGGPPATGSSSGAATSGTGTSSSNDTSTGVLDGTATDSGVGFLRPDDLPHYVCDIGDQDCARGEKCMPYRFPDSDSFIDAVACFDVAPDPKGLHEACEYIGMTWSGSDDCGVGQVCWDIDGDGTGFCKRICRTDGASCGVGEVISTCQTCACFCDLECDLVAQDCPAHLRCVVGGYGYADVSCTEATASLNAGLGEPCEYPWDCAGGLHCSERVGAAGCEADLCCTPFCDAEKPGVCPLPGQECVQIWDGALGRLAAAGVCRVPE